MLTRITTLSLIPALALATGCTVDSNARLTLGGGGDKQHESDQTVAAPALSDQPASTGIAGDSSPVNSIDRGDWQTTTFVVPAFEVRHGAFSAIHTDLAPDQPRWDGRAPTPESALDYERGDPWRQIAEVPQSYGAMFADLFIGAVRLIEHGPAGWHASPRWDGQRDHPTDAP